VDRIVSLETQLYSLGNDRLVWAGRSETTNPQSVSKLIDSVIKHVLKALHSEGLLAGVRCTEPACASIVPAN
jgi:hypothetical protein